MGSPEMSQSYGSRIAKAVGRILAVALISFFVWQVVIAAGKLQDKKTAVSVTTHYEDSRLMPSFSVCFRNKKENYQYNGTEVDMGLKVTRSELLKDFKHEHDPEGEGGSTVDDKTSENIFMHIGNRMSSNPYECIAYKPTAKNSPRKKEWYEIKLNVAQLGSQEVDVYLYTNGHVSIPRYSTGVYGSVMKKFKFASKTSTFAKFYVRKNRVMNVDRNGQRCSADTKQETVGRCIARYLEDTYNCTAYLLMANRSKPFCNKETMNVMVQWFNGQFKSMPEADIFNLTSCLPHCERDEISLDDTPEGSSWSQGAGNTLHMIFLFEDGSYKLQEEYVVYDVDDFIADVGGYLGLLLGHSMLSIYYMSVEWFGKNNFVRALYYSKT